jgi:Arc/MetJ-type ribon-helix-helix transcriptional regulator
MRTIVNLSLPPKTAEQIKKRSKTRGFASTSSYIRFLIESDGDDLITEEEILRLSKLADKEYRENKLIKAKSLADLI